MVRWSDEEDTTWNSFWAIVTTIMDDGIVTAAVAMIFMLGIVFLLSGPYQDGREKE